MTDRTTTPQPSGATTAPGGSRAPGRWAHRIAAKYGLDPIEGRHELQRLAAAGWMTWEFHARFADDSKDSTE